MPARFSLDWQSPDAGRALHSLIGPANCRCVNAFVDGMIRCTWSDDGAFRLVRCRIGVF